jgi:DNA-binding transcriptional LysR family regulator
MREIFRDDLFVRHGSLMIPTAKAISLLPHIKSASSVMEQLFTHSGFKPENMTRTFCIGGCDNAVFYALAPAVGEIFKRAPNIKLAFEDLSSETFSALENGSMDMAVYPRVSLNASIHSVNLFTTGYAVLARPDHPLIGLAAADGTVKLDQLALYRQVEANAQPNKSLPPNGPAQGKFAQGSRSIAISTPFFLTVPPLLLATDFYAVMPEKSARALAAATGLKLLGIEDAGETLTPRLIWHDRVHFDPAHQWLRSMFVAYAQNPVPSLSHTTAPPAEKEPVRTGSEQQ